MKENIKRRRIVARIMAAENKSEAVAAEAKRAGVSTRTVERWVEAAKAAGPAVGQPVMSENAPPPEKPAENPVLDKLLGGEAGGSEGPKGPPTPTEIHDAAKDAEQFCVEAYAGSRSAVGSFLVSWKFTPPLDATSPEVLQLLRVSKAAELAIRANAPRIYPILVKYASNWAALVLAVGMDAIGMIMGLESLAKSRGWAPQARKATDAPPRASVPTPEQYGEQLRRPPPPAPAPDPSDAKAKAGIIDAPLPTEKQKETAKDVMEVLRG